MRQDWSVGSRLAVVCSCVALLAGCEDRDFSPPSQTTSGTPAGGLNVNGFWEGELSDGTVCAAPLAQSGASVSGECKLRDRGNLSGTLNGYHLTFTFTHGDGSQESGEGDFDQAGMSFEADIASAGHFMMLWRGPDFEHHDPYGAPLTYSK
jgi:hypothetical protein